MVSTVSLVFFTCNGNDEDGGRKNFDVRNGVSVVKVFQKGEYVPVVAERVVYV